MTTIDLFSGAGGITQGFKWAGFKCLFANDFNEQALSTFKLNNPETQTIGGPIENIDPAKVRKSIGIARGELDVLVGGPPCQGFSINAPGRFLEDPRNSLFKNYISFLDEFRPKSFFFENVPGMLSLGRGVIFQRIINELEAHGYIVEAKILFAAHYGVPQERWRLVILGTRVGHGIPHPLPTHYLQRRANFTGGSTYTFRLDEAHQARMLAPVTVSEAIFDLPKPVSRPNEIVRYTKTKISSYAKRMRGECVGVYNHEASNISEINKKRMEHIPPGGSWRDIPYELLPAGMKRAKRSDHTKRYGRLHPNGLASTIMTKCDPHWGPVFHPMENRTLTVREAARFQSFPDNFIFSGTKVSQYEQVGNAVPPLLAFAVACCIREHLGVSRISEAI